MDLRARRPIMGTKNTSTVSDIPAFAWAPGDKHRYVWDGQDVIIVQRIDKGPGGAVTYIPTGDVIQAPATRTATAFCAAVNEWRTKMGGLL
jgi:hypothetical protein